MNAVSGENFKTYYDGFVVQKINGEWVANHDYFENCSLSGRTVAGLMQMIDDFYHEDEDSEDEGFEQDDY